MNKTPLENYHQQIKNKSIMADDEQFAVMKIFDDIFSRLMVEVKVRNNLLAIFRKQKSVKGLYLYGGVGIGKTMMMDCFYNALPFTAKLRMHFHAFMRMIHKELKQYQGHKNPITLIAKDLASKYVLICFDEFNVTDITDAMLLGRMLDALFINGVTLVTTSNIKPDDLYKRGLQREQFLPAIELLKKFTKVHHILTTQDYRLRHLNHASVFFIPNDAEAREEMEKSFQLLTKNKEIISGEVKICGRKIAIVKATSDIIWFNFNEICSPPRSQLDYLEIAEKYNTVFISDVPLIASGANNIASLFIRLIDVLYDAHVRIAISAEDNVENLYTHGRMVFEYTRACSRLREMQSDHYFFRTSN